MLAYAVLACFTFWNYALGPALTLLRKEQHFSYTVLSGHTALWAGGAALAGAAFPVAAGRLSRPALLWCSALAASGGAALFASGRGVATLAGAGVLGLSGTMLLAVTQAVLSDRHGPRRDRALTEANIGAGACAVLAPLALGALAAGPAGWRIAYGLPALALAALYLRYRHQPLPTPPARGTAAPSRRLPVACWLFITLTATGMAVEFCLVYFGAEQLTATGLSINAAATAMSSHYVGLLTGRIGGALATRQQGRTVPLLCVSLAITAGGFLLFWLTHVPAVAVLGLLLCGLGVANLYPLSLALAFAAAPGHEDRANGRTQLLCGLLVVTAPSVLGNLADRVGLGGAFAIEPVLIALCLLLLLTGLHARRVALRLAEAAED